MATILESPEERIRKPKPTEVDVNEQPFEDPYPSEAERLAGELEVEKIRTSQKIQTQSAQNEKKVDLVEGLLMVFIGLIMDLIDILILLLEFVAIGFLINPIADLLNFLVFQFWFRIKGMPSVPWIISSIIESIPVIPLDFLPLRTVGIIFSIIIANNPKLAKLAKPMSPGKAIS